MDEKNVTRLFGENTFKIKPTETEVINGIYQMSDMPNLVIDSEKDCYIGYEHVGEAYLGKNRLIFQPIEMETTKTIAECVKDGVLLDLGCGDGYYTVPCAKLGMKVIAGDISNKMMSLLQEKALVNDVSLDNVILCRMNALDIPLSDEGVDGVIANNLLHLISHPEKVVDEIYRVLKKGGVFICFDDAPGKGGHENTDYHDAIGEIYRRYWEYLGRFGISGRRYSWRFDRNGYCETKFRKEERTISFHQECSETVEEVFLPRFIARGFSDQTAVPEKEHKEAVQYALEETDKRFGKGWRKFSVDYTIGDIIATVFTKM